MEHAMGAGSGEPVGGASAGGVGDGGSMPGRGAVRPSSRRRCPGCGADRVRRVLRGLPTASSLIALEADDVVLGGCLVGGDDAPAACLACGVSVWPDRVFSRGEGSYHRVVGGLEWTVHPDGGVSVVGDGDLTFDGADADVLLLRLTVGILDRTPSFRMWLERRGLRVQGDPDPGAVDRVALSDDGLTVVGDAGRFTVAPVARVLLGLVADVLGRRRRTVAEVVRWLEDEHDVVPAVLG